MNYNCYWRVKWKINDQLWRLIFFSINNQLKLSVLFLYSCTCFFFCLIVFYFYFFVQLLTWLILKLTRIVFEKNIFFKSRKDTSELEKMNQFQLFLQWPGALGFYFCAFFLFIVHRGTILFIYIQYLSFLTRPFDGDFFFYFIHQQQ